jgi:hypothetical protein
MVGGKLLGFRYRVGAAKVHAMTPWTDLMTYETIPVHQTGGNGPTTDYSKGDIVEVVYNECENSE